MSSGGPTISKLTIEGFKSIVSATLEPARRNVLIGADGSGKSNLLDRFVRKLEAFAATSGA